MEMRGMRTTETSKSEKKERWLVYTNQRSFFSVILYSVTLPQFR